MKRPTRHLTATAGYFGPLWTVGVVTDLNPFTWGLSMRWAWSRKRGTVDVNVTILMVSLTIRRDPPITTTAPDGVPWIDPAVERRIRQWRKDNPRKERVT